MATPEVSVLLVTDHPPSLREVLAAYRVQTGGDRLEIVIAMLPGVDKRETEHEARAFAHLNLVEVDTASLREAEWQALHAATAPYIIFAQSLAFPTKDAVAAMLRAHQTGRWAVVGPQLRCANPERIVARTSMAIQYGVWERTASAGGDRRVAAHNSCYDRATLLGLGDELYELLEAGWSLQKAIVDQGGRPYLEPKACMELLMVSRLGWLPVDNFCQSVKYASKRCLRWGLSRRILYAAAAPLIPVVRLGRILNDRAGKGELAYALSLLPTLTLGLVAGGLGEAVGYLVGDVTAGQAMRMSLHRRDYTHADGS